MHITIFWIGCCLITNLQRADSSRVHHKHLNVRFVRSETTHKTQNTTAPVALTHRGYPWTQGAPLLCSIPSDNMNISALRLGHLIVKLTQPSLRFPHQRASKALVFFFCLFVSRSSRKWYFSIFYFIFNWRFSENGREKKDTMNPFPYYH